MAVPEFASAKPCRGLRGQVAARQIIAAAVKSWMRIFKSGPWSRSVPLGGRAVLKRLAESIHADAVEFVVDDTLDMGEPSSEMLGLDSLAASMTFQYFVKSIAEVDGFVANTASADLHGTLREPLGVVVGIVLRNPPMAAAWEVVRPMLARMFVEAARPPDAFDVVHGRGKDAGKAPARHRGDDETALTGWAEVGTPMLIDGDHPNMRRDRRDFAGALRSKRARRLGDHR